MNSMFRIRMIAVAAMLTLAAGAAFAQRPFAPPRSSAMGNAGDAVLNGIDAIGINPAQIPLQSGTHVSIAVVPFGMQAGTDFIPYSTYQKYFVGSRENTAEPQPVYLTTSDKDVILGAFHGPVGTFTANGTYTLFAAVVSVPELSIGVHMTDKIASRATVPRAFAEFLLYGNPPGRRFDFSDMRIGSSWTREYGVTAAQRFPLGRRFGAPAISFGATVKLVHGYGYFGVDRFKSWFTTDPDSFAVSGHVDMHAQYAGTEWLAQKDPFLFRLFPDPVGSGFGVDLGARLELNSLFAIGVSLTDVGTIRWNRGAKEVAAKENFIITDASSDAQFEEIKQRLNGKERSVGSFSTPLPTAMTVSASYAVPRFLWGSRPLTFAGALRQGFADMPGSSTTPMVGAGMEWEAVEGIALRGGITAGGGAPARVTVGLGLRMDSFTLDLATNNLETITSPNFSAASFSVSSRLDF